MASEPYPWATALDTLHDQVWTLLVRGVNDRRAASRHPTLATVARDGTPQARTVVLRAADRAAGTLDIHTDLGSAKVSELRAAPLAGLHVWDRGAHLQIRAGARVDILTGAEVAAIWARVPDGSRSAYGTIPPPGTPVADALDYDKTADRDAFAVLRLQLQEIDALHLGADHRRARYRRSDGWAGAWLAP